MTRSHVLRTLAHISAWFVFWGFNGGIGLLRSKVTSYLSEILVFQNSSNRWYLVEYGRLEVHLSYDFTKYIIDIGPAENYEEWNPTPERKLHRPSASFLTFDHITVRIKFSERGSRVNALNHSSMGRHCKNGLKRLQFDFRFYLHKAFLDSSTRWILMIVSTFILWS